MGVRANHDAGAAIAEITHRLLFARRLAMKIDDHRIRAAAERTSGELAIDRGERIFERVHEDASHRVDDQRTPAILCLDQRRAASRRAGRIVDRPDEPRRPFDENQGLFLIPGVIAERDCVDAAIDEFAIDRLGDAKAAG